MEFIPGLVARKGRELGIPTPAMDAVVEIDRRINRGELKMDPSNFELLKAEGGTLSYGMLAKDRLCQVNIHKST